MSEQIVQVDVDSVIAPLVGFSKIASKVIGNMQTSICQLLKIANAQEVEITQLRKLVESIMTREKATDKNIVEERIGESTSERDCAALGVTLESVTRDADIFSQVDQHDELLKKMEMRKKVIMYPGVKPTQEQLAVYYAPGDALLQDTIVSHPLTASKTQKELDLEAARKAILDRARQYTISTAATTYGTNAR